MDIEDINECIFWLNSLHLHSHGVASGLLSTSIHRQARNHKLLISCDITSGPIGPGGPDDPGEPSNPCREKRIVTEM